jgi:1-acyl-sn-glycerol-3-phosphate acyltransferase
VRATATALAVVRVVYGVYAWSSLLLHSGTLAAVLAVLPGLDRRRRAARVVARLFFRSIGSPVVVAGATPPEGACVVVANHSSYLDGMILTAALPPRFTFLIKREMAHVPLAGFVLRRLGSKFVDRANAKHRQQTARDLVASAGSGDALALFPEGTFDARPGLRAFHSGAFGAAWRAALPVMPVVVLGARAKLAAGAVLPRPGPLEVRFCLALASEHFRSAKDLMHAARGAMLEQLGEPDLAAQRPGAEAPTTTESDAEAPAATAPAHIAE